MSQTKGVVYIKIDGLREALQGLDTPAIRKAARRTLADLTKMAKTEASAGIRRRFNVKKRDLDPRMVVVMPTFASMTGEIKVSGAPIPLVYFGAKQLRDVAAGVVVRNNRGGVKAQKRAKGLRGVTYSLSPGVTENLPHAFIAWHRRWGRYEVFQRKGKERYEIRSFRSITIASMFEQGGVIGPVTKRVQAEFDGRFRHHLRYFIEQVGR
jgi:hypothetical protein